MSAQTRSESALIRPFANLDAADEPLERVQLLVDDEEPKAPGPVVLAPELLATAKLRLSMPSGDELRAAIAQTDLAVVDTALVVMARGHSHRASHQIIEPMYLRTAEPDSPLVIDRNEGQLVLQDLQGFTVTVAVVLLHDLTPAPLRPYMAGTWLARRDFRLSPAQEETSFSPEYLTKAVREHFGLPEGTLRFVNVEGVLTADDLSDAVDVYLDEDVLNLLLANPAEAVAIEMQTELAILATEAVAAAVVRELGEGGAEVTPDSLSAHEPALRFFQNLAKKLNVDLASMLGLAADLPRLRASLEAAFDLRSAALGALKEL